MELNDSEINKIKYASNIIAIEGMEKFQPLILEWLESISDDKRMQLTVWEQLINLFVQFMFYAIIPEIEGQGARIGFGEANLALYKMHFMKALKEKI